MISLCLCAQTFLTGFTGMEACAMLAGERELLRRLRSSEGGLM